MQKEKRIREGFGLRAHLLFLALTGLVMGLCFLLGSVNLPFRETTEVMLRALLGSTAQGGRTASILLQVRVPRVLCSALAGASLALCGAAMQGLLRNPLADGGTLGVSSGASLGAVVAIAMGTVIPGFPVMSTPVSAMLFAFLSLLLILSLSYTSDRSFSTNTIILMGVIFSMFASSLISLITAFSGEKIRTIMFWTMGSLAATNFDNVLLLTAMLVVAGGIILSLAQELNAFALGEENAHHLGVHVRGVKITLMVTVSALIGVCVAIGGSIAFVGLIVPHTVRLLVGANHRKVLSGSIYLGAIFLMLCDLLARTIVSPLELPVGVITSLLGAVVFTLIFRQKAKGADRC